jgi:gluconate 2-dehydrogenase gamma chain
VLLAYDKAALALGPKPEKPQNAFEAMTMGPPVMKPAWVKLKGIVINTYYMSEVACTQELIYEHVPGPFVSSLPVTATTRPWASTGPF